MTLQPLTDDELPALPETSYLGDDASWGYDASDMRDHANRAAERQRLKSEQELAKVEPVAAQHRFRHPQKTMPDWSLWQHCEIRNRPSWAIDSQGYEVEYRTLYPLPPNAAARTAELEARCAELESVMKHVRNVMPNEKWADDTKAAINAALETKHEQG